MYRCFRRIDDELDDRNGIADALGESPRSAEELARDTGTDAGALARTRRVLSAEGIFEARNGGWGHTPTSRLLRSDHPQSMRLFVRTIGLSVYWRGFEYFADALRTGESIQEKVVPGGFWNYLSGHLQAARLFDEAMMGKATGQLAGVLRSCDFSSFQRIADIGVAEQFIRFHPGIARPSTPTPNGHAQLRPIP